MEHARQRVLLLQPLCKSNKGEQSRAKKIYSELSNAPQASSQARCSKNIAGSALLTILRGDFISSLEIDSREG